MKLSSRIGLVCLMVFSLSLGGMAFAADKSLGGGFKGPGPAVKTVQEVMRLMMRPELLKDDTPVTLKGRIIERLGDERYTFKDATGTIVVDIDDEDWKGLEVTPEMDIIIEGEVDKKRSRIEVDADSIRLAN